MTEVAVSSGADEWEEEDGDVCIGDEDCGYSPGGDPGDGIVRDTLCLGPEEILRLQCVFLSLPRGCLSMY